MSFPGTCPTCEAQGELGAECVERVCARQGVHLIPPELAATHLRLPASQREPLVGQCIGDYLVIDTLGKGGFGVVLLGLQRPLFKLRAAIKLIAFEQQDERAQRLLLTKFENEAATLAVLQHPNIVRLLHYGTFQERPYLCMEYVPGSHTLQTEIRRLVQGSGALDAVSVRRVLEQMLHALEEAHDQQIIHRDIKPENVMLQSVKGDDWHVKLVDFGLAKVVAEHNETSIVLGTPMYMAPEQVVGHCDDGDVGLRLGLVVRD